MYAAIARFTAVATSNTPEFTVSIEEWLGPVDEEMEPFRVKAQEGRMLSTEEETCTFLELGDALGFAQREVCIHLGESIY
jgi:hypothetical protein